MRWIWDPVKSRANRTKHGLSLDTAEAVFGDPLALSRPDPHTGEERWQTIGLVGSVMLLVIHTEPREDPESHELVGRIISARKATAHERRAYEEGEF